MVGSKSKCNCEVNFHRSFYKSSFGNTVSYQYCDSNDSKNKKPNVILIHGVAFDSSYWKCLMKELCPYANVYAPDLPGTGQTTLPANPESFRLSDLVLGLREFIEHLELKSVYLVGHGLGAVISLEYSVEYPSSVVKIISASANPQWFPNQETDWSCIIHPELLQLLGMVGQPDVDKLKLCTDINNIIDPITCPEQKYLVDHYMKLGEQFMTYQIITQTTNIRPHVANVSVPTLILSGQLEPIAPICATQFLDENIKNATVFVFPNQGHNYPLFNTKLFNKHVMSWIFDDFEPPKPDIIPIECDEHKSDDKHEKDTCFTICRERRYIKPRYTGGSKECNYGC